MVVTNVFFVIMMKELKICSSIVVSPDPYGQSSK
jgi:hypothetical protein